VLVDGYPARERTPSDGTTVWVLTVEPTPAHVIDSTRSSMARGSERELHEIASRRWLMNDPIANVLAQKGNDVVTVAPETTVLVAVQQMNDRRIGALLVVDRGKPVGIFTERDVLVRVVAAGLDPKVTPVSEVMTRGPVIIRSDVTVSQAMVVITERRCRHLPVVDGSKLRGLISIGDLTSWVVRDQQRMIDDLHDYMTRA
jgi:CBS domain-containing protein